MKDDTPQAANVCRICGWPLTDTDDDLCTACRAMETVKGNPTRTVPEKGAGRTRRGVRTREKTKKRMNPLTRNLLIAVCVLTVIFAALTAASVILYDLYSPERFLDLLDTALATGDTRTLGLFLQGDDLAISSEGTAALCLAFEDQKSREELRAQLSAQAIDPAAGGPYPALRLVKTPVFLGYGRCSLGVHSVQLLLAAPARDVRLSLDNVPRTGEQTADGILYKNLFPGLYTCSGTVLTAAGQPVTGNITTLRLFSSEEPTLFDGALPVASVSISNCVSDEAVISVDGVTVRQRPMHSIVTLPQVAVGSVIRMEYQTPWGAVTRGEVTFSDPNQTSLAFTNLTTEGGIPTSDDLNPLLSIFFGTYLDAINNQDPARISGCTEFGRVSMNAAAGTEYQTGHLFLLDAVTCAPIVTSEMESSGTPRVTCCARMDYHIMNRETNEERSLTDFARCTFIWQDGWLLDTYTPIDEPTYNTALDLAQG